MNSAPLPELPTQPVTLRTSGAVDRLTATAEKAKQYAERARSTNTRRAYRADWNHFAAFCDAHSLMALPAAPETLGLYLTELAETGYKASTLSGASPPSGKPTDRPASPRHRPPRRP